MKKLTKRPLHLHAQILRHLTRHELAPVIGGQPGTTTGTCTLGYPESGCITYCIDHTC